MRRSILLPLLPAVVLLLAARKPDDPKYERHLQAPPAPAMGPLTVTLTESEAQSEFIVVATRLTNSSVDQMVVHRRDEASIVTGAGAFHPRATGLFAGPVVLPPSAEKGYAFKVEGESGFNVDSFMLELGGFYTANNVGTAIPVQDFALPVAANSFTAGSFACNLKDSSQESQETNATFTCTYSGSGLGYIDPRKVAMRVPSGQEFANAKTKGDREVLLPGGVAKFQVVFKDPDVVDMQKVSLQLVWRDAFAETPLTPIPAASWAFTLDAAATAEANE